jgi:thymidylate kinase
LWAALQGKKVYEDPHHKLTRADSIIATGTDKRGNTVELVARREYGNGPRNLSDNEQGIEIKREIIGEHIEGLLAQHLIQHYLGESQTPRQIIKQLISLGFERGEGALGGIQWEETFELLEQYTDKNNSKNRSTGIALLGIAGSGKSTAARRFQEYQNSRDSKYWVMPEATNQAVLYNRYGLSIFDYIVHDQSNCTYQANASLGEIAMPLANNNQTGEWVSSVGVEDTQNYSYVGSVNPRSLHARRISNFERLFLYTIDSIERETKTNILYSHINQLNQETGTPVCAIGNVYQTVVFALASAGFNEIPERIKRLLEYLPWQPEHFVLFDPDPEIHTEMNMDNSPDEKRKRTQMLEVADNARNLFYDLVKYFMDREREISIINDPRDNSQMDNLFERIYNDQERPITRDDITQFLDIFMSNDVMLSVDRRNGESDEASSKQGFKWQNALKHLIIFSQFDPKIIERSLQNPENAIKMKRMLDECKHYIGQTALSLLADTNQIALQVLTKWQQEEFTTNPAVNLYIKFANTLHDKQTPRAPYLIDHEEEERSELSLLESMNSFIAQIESSISEGEIPPLVGKAIIIYYTYGLIYPKYKDLFEKKGNKDRILSQKLTKQDMDILIRVSQIAAELGTPTASPIHFSTLSGLWKAIERLDKNGLVDKIDEVVVTQEALLTAALSAMGQMEAVRTHSTPGDNSNDKNTRISGLQQLLNLLQQKPKVRRRKNLSIEERRARRRQMYNPSSRG